MIWMTGKANMVEDLGCVLSWFEVFQSGKRKDVSSEDIVLISHSAGGGFSQYFLRKELGNVGDLVILVGSPCLRWLCELRISFITVTASAFD
jgi:hypothetical protein